MSLDYSQVLSAIVTRIAGDATVTTNIGKLGDLSDVKCVFALQAHPLATSDKPTIVVTRVSAPQVASFANDAVTMRFDVHLFYGRGRYQYPNDTGKNCFLILDAVRARINRWAPTATGMSCAECWLDNEIDAHDDDTWHWVQSYTVTMTET
jgi:hypothetical protein